MSTLLEALVAAAEARPSNLAVVEGRRELGYEALLRAILGPVEGAGGIRAIPAAGATDTLVAVLRCRRAGAVPALGGATPPDHALPQGTAFLRATSGTTGTPRFVAFSEAQAASAARRSGSMLALEPGQVVVTTVPATTSFGWVAGLLGPLLAGVTVVVAPSQAPREMLELAALWRAAWIVTTPPLVRSLARLLALERQRRPAVRVLVASSEYPSEAASQLLAHDVRVVDRYGASEAGPVAQAPEPLAALRPASGVEVAVRNGCLEVRSDAVALGELGGRRFDGVFQTTDLVRLEPDGGFRLLGRADRIVRRAGRSIDLERLETLLRGLPGIDGARVVAEPGALDVELVARVVAAAGASMSPESVLAQIAPQLEPWERPRRLEFVAASEATGKW